VGRRAWGLSVALLLTGCSWFTDFKEQPKIDPWETPADSIPFRGNPQMSVSVYGSAAPGFMYDRAPTPQNLTAMAGLVNPVPADSASVNRGRIEYQINCAVCHGPLGMGNGPAVKYGLFPPAIGAGSPAATTLSDGYIFAIIRNGRANMPPYNRIEEPERWDIVNYMRTLQGKGAFPADTSHCRPGETGACLPGASRMGPTRPAPYSGHVFGGLVTAAPPAAAAPVDTTKKAPTPADTAKKPEHTP
jgi:mono/diheme cytochrome c family protein